MTDIKRGTKTEYIAKLDALSKHVYTLEDEAARRSVSMLRDALTQINARIITADGWRLENLSNLQRQVKDLIAAFESELTNHVNGYVAQAWELGQRAVDEPLKISGVSLSPARLSRNVIAVLQGYSADLIKRISNETLTAINGTLAQAMLGLQNPLQAQQRITQLIGVSDNLSDLTGISARAESIFRTEVGRVNAIATQARQDQVAQMVPDLMKSWVATGDHRTRSGHLAAHGQSVRIDQPFSIAAYIGGPKEDMMYPRDPRGSANNIIRCRCRSITWRAGYGELLPKTTAKVDAEKQRRAKEEMINHAR